MVFFFINRLVSRGYLFRVVVLYLFILCLWKWKDWRLVFVFFSFLIRLVVPRGSLRIKIKKTLTACLHFSNTTKRCSQELISSVSISSVIFHGNSINSWELVVFSFLFITFLLSTESFQGYHY